MRSRPWSRSLLYDIFHAAATRYPSHIALDIPPGAAHPLRVRLTYEALRLRCEGLAACLAPYTQPDAIVAILLARDTPDLYAAQLAVLRAGAAFTCIDPAFPDAHLADVLADAGAVALITDAAGRRRVEQCCAVLLPLINPNATPPPTPAAEPQISASDLAYVIYTSGTTGKPKGVLIEHHSITNLIEGDVTHFGLTGADRVAQCSSPAYDSSIEETWLAFSVGATLVPLDDETVRLGPDLVPWLAREKITVLCPPPTLLRMSGCANPKAALPELKLLYVGGEPLPPDLADRWSAGRWMENGYGPTECTVTVTRARVRPGEAVTIGRSVPGCQAFVLDESLNAVPNGEAGELCIAGAGLARGYHKREQLTVEKFPLHPALGRIYRTGDRVRRNELGDLEYLGRIDAQVKLRGYRIELSGIEAMLVSCPGICAAACKVQGEGAGQLLAAHLVAVGIPPTIDELKETLRRTLPDYMIPARFAFHDVLPVTVGGKLDRKALPDIGAARHHNAGAIVPPRNAAERKVFEAFRLALNRSDEFSIYDDFFLDLGGNSLSAVEVICQLRAADAAAIAVRDLYEGRTVARLAELPMEAAPSSSLPVAARRRGNPVSCTLIQCLWLAVQMVFGSALIWVVLFSLLPALMRNLGWVQGMMIAALVGTLAIAIYVPFSIALTVLLKRILIGRYKALRTPVWSGFFLRHWIVASAASLIPWPLLLGTSFAPLALRALGAKVGRRVHIHRGVDLRRGGWDLLTIGDGVTLAQDAAIGLTELWRGELVIGPVTIGEGATLDVRAGLSPDSLIAAGGYLTPHSVLPSGNRIPPGERWDGIPARPAGKAPATPLITGGGDLPAWLQGLALLAESGAGLALAATMPALIALTAWFFVPGISAGVAVSWLQDPRLTWQGLGTTCALATAALVVSLLFSALIMRLMGPVRPGIFSDRSWEALRIWVKTGMVQSAGRWLSGSMLWPWWLRLAGMRIGRGCEISTLIDVVPEMVRIGDGSFFADGIYFCAPWRYRGTITVSASELGRGTFLGNHAVVPAGYVRPDGFFVGVSTVADSRPVQPGSAWFGHPPMELPRREIVAADESLTTNPGPLRFATRLFWELLRFVLPSLPILIGCAWLAAMDVARRHVDVVLQALVVAPLLTATSGIVACLAVVALKWLLLGRMRPGQHAFWSCWCGRWDFLFVSWTFWAAPWLALLEGTLVLNAFLRLTGARLGRRVVLGSAFTQLVDPDMLVVADDATLSCHLQAHSFEDRVLKLDHVRVGQGATVGHNAVLFFGTLIGEDTVVEPHSVVMKRDVLAAGGRYEGCPTRPASVLQ